MASSFNQLSLISPWPILRLNHARVFAQLVIDPNFTAYWACVAQKCGLASLLSTNIDLSKWLS